MSFIPTLNDYQPVGNRLLLKVSSKDKVGEVFLPNTVNERWMKVIKEGTITSFCKEGDMVLVGQMSAPPDQFEFGGEKYIQIMENSVIGICKVDEEIEYLDDQKNVNVA